ncbi:MAG: hypothetical protein HON90_12325, partial [Halobacteriovoraceae bacterium]|nr:hypothetical protein [Halobacteriovoraceae bacterium]
YHFKKHSLYKVKEARLEFKLHITRNFLFFIIYTIVGMVTVTGSFVYFVFALLLLDIFVGFFDVLVEPSSRLSLGGLPGGEYFLHMLLSFLLGMFHLSYFLYLWKLKGELTNIAISPHSYSGTLLVVIGVFSLILTILKLSNLYKNRSLYPVK